jgi:molybdate transport system permease protein
MNSFSSGELQTLWLSFRVACLVVLLIMPLAIYLGYKLARGKWLSARVLIETLVLLPLALPPVAMGYLLLLLFGSSGPIGSFLYDVFGIHVSFTMFGAVLAAAVVSFPLAVRSVRVSMEAIDVHLEEAAATLGASPWQTFTKITLPLAWPGILSGAVLAFIRSLGEFGATMILAGNIEGETRTLSVALWTFLQRPDGESAAFRLLAFSVIFGFICLLLSEIAVRRLRRYRFD